MIGAARHARDLGPLWVTRVGKTEAPLLGRLFILQLSWLLLLQPFYRRF
jgi:hypothetical protein